MNRPAPPPFPEHLDPSIARPPLTGPALYVDDSGELESLCRRFGSAEALAVDTEFVRERTFFPGLGLIQLSDGRETALVDPLAVKDLEPLRELLAEPQIVKVLHSCSEDMEVFFHCFGELPRPLFDTQIAAAFAGLGFSLGYAALVKEVFGVELPKGETRTDWLRRPLREAQLEYASLDVAHLLPLYDVLSDTLDRLGRENWAAEEFHGLLDTHRFLPDPDEVYRKIKRAHLLDRRQLATLKRLAAWRERTARERDLPRNFVVQENALSEIARRQPKNLRDLARLGELRQNDVRRHGEKILEIVGATRAQPESEYPPKLEMPLNLAPHKKTVNLLRQAVTAKAEELELPVALLATRKTVESLVRRAVDGRPQNDEILPRELRGWRREVIGNRLLELLER